MKSKQAFILRTLALMVSLILVFGNLPVSALDAEEVPDYEAETYAEEETVTEPETTTEPEGLPEEITEEEPIVAPVGEGEGTEEPIPAETTADPTTAPDETPEEATEPPEEESTEPDAALKDGYYLIGPNWVLDDVKENHWFVRNTKADGEEYMLKVELTEGQQIKVAHVKDNKIESKASEWFPSEGDPYTVDKEHAGNTIIYFRPSYQDNKDWRPFGGYMHIAPTITVDEYGEEKDTSIKKDEVKPNLEIISYSNDDDKGNQKWVSGNDTVTVTVKADDNGGEVIEANWGLNTNSFKKNGSRVATKDLGSDRYEIILSEPGKVKKSAVELTVSDYAGNISEAVKTKALLIDDKAPSVDDIKSGNFKSAETAYDKIMSALSFGLYHNDTILFEMKIDHNGGSPIKSAVLQNTADGNKEYTPISVTSDDNRSTLTFELPINDDGSVNKSYKLVISDIEDEAGNKMTDSVNIVDITLTSEDQAVTADKDLFEVIATILAPSVAYTVTDADNNADKAIYDGKIVASAEITDSVSGVTDIKAYFGPLGEDGTVTQKAKFIVDGDNAATYDEKFANTDKTKKITSRKVDIILPDQLDTGKYGLLVQASNLAGNTSPAEPKTILIDNDPPVIGDHSVVIADTDEKIAAWTNRTAKVKFTASDEADSFFEGVKTKDADGEEQYNITVTGSVTEKTYDVFNEGGDNYYFTPDIHQDYQVFVKDSFGHTAELTVKAEEVLIDYDAPYIKDVLYDGESYDQSPWHTKEDGVAVTVIVSDYSEKAKTWLSGEESMIIKAVGSLGGKEYVAERDAPSDTEDGYAYKFTSQLYQTYDVTATDAAENKSDITTTKNTKVDSAVPEINGVTFAPQDMSAFEKFFNLLSFGLYSKEKIVMTVSVVDEKDSSNIKEIKAFYENGDPIDPVKPLDAKPAENTSEKTEAQVSFLLEKDVFKGENIAVQALDFAGYDTDKTSLYEIKERVTAKDTELALDAGKMFEIIGSTQKAKISGMYVGSAEDGVEPYEDPESHQRWFPGDVNTSFTVEDTVTHIHSVEVKLNGEPITDACFYQTDDGLESLPAQFTDFDSHSGDKVSNLTVTFRTADENIARYLNRTGDGDDKNGENKIEVTAVSNNRLSSDTFTEYFYVDTSKPVIDRIEFSDKTGEVPAERVKTTYGYYFQNNTTVTVYASDKGSGVYDITLQGTSVPNAGYDTQDFPADTHVVAMKTGESGTTTFEIPAGFKGQLSAWATDNVKYESQHVGPDGLIVESESTHNAASNAKITVNTQPNGKDHNGTNDLFSGDVSVTFDIYDMYSGLKEISYRIIDTQTPDPAYTTLSIENGQTPDVQYLDGWRVGGESNLIYTAQTTITVSAQEHNDNDVKIQLKGVDKAGFEIPQVETTISIDITNPTVKVDYSPVLSEAFHRNDNYYFNKVRTAEITVTERNFDPDDFDLSKYIAIEGNRPALAGGSNWSRSYDLSAGTGNEQRTAEHKATITFSEDGKYEVDFDYTDLAGNSAENQFEKETFYIDMTKPVMTVSLQDSASPRYYQSNTANIKIVEHNFDPAAEYLVYDAVATGPDNSSSATPPQISAWSSSGDEHTATITYGDANQGKHNFKITYKDLADNAADDHTEDIFYIDHTANKPEFERVTNKAYDGTIAPVVQYDDYNFNEAITAYTVKLTRHAYNFETMQQETDVVEYNNSRQVKYTSGSYPVGATITYSDFAKEEIVDGIYTLYAEYTDMAGNKADNSITFSVNRFGSVFVLGSAQTTSLVESVYTKDAPDVVIREISAIPHTAYTAALSYNSSNKDLNEKSSEYKVSVPNSVGEWYEYMYQIFASNFEKEGEYTVTVSSEYKIDDKTTNVTNRTANTSGEVERNCPVSFVVDKTAPVVSITGVDENGFYSEAEKTLHIVCSDDNIDKDSLTITLDGNTVNLEESKAVVDDSLFGELDIELPIEADGHETKHSIMVDVKDYARNSGDNAINAFTLSATFLTMFFHNTVALIVTGAVLAALIALGVILVLRKRKNSAN